MSKTVRLGADFRLTQAHLGFLVAFRMAQPIAFYEVEEEIRQDLAYSDEVLRISHIKPTLNHLIQQKSEGAYEILKELESSEPLRTSIKRVAEMFAEVAVKRALRTLPSKNFPKSRIDAARKSLQQISDALWVNPRNVVMQHHGYFTNNKTNIGTILDFVK